MNPKSPIWDEAAKELIAETGGKLPSESQVEGMLDRVMEKVVAAKEPPKRRRAKKAKRDKRRRTQTARRKNRR